MDSRTNTLDQPHPGGAEYRLPQSLLRPVINSAISTSSAPVGVGILLFRLTQAASALLATYCALALCTALAVPTVADPRLWGLLLATASACRPLQSYAALGGPGLSGILVTIRTLLESLLLVGGVQLLLGLAGHALAGPVFLGTLFGLASLGSLGARGLIAWLLRPWNRPFRLAILGAGEFGQASARYLIEHEPAIEVVGFIDDRLSRIDLRNLPFPLLASTFELERLPPDLDGVIIALPSSAAQRACQLASRLRVKLENIYVAPELPMLRHTFAHWPSEGPHKMLVLGVNRLPFSGRVLKRLFDLLFSLSALLVFLPLGVLIALLIKLESPGPVFFRQLRYGLGNRLFEIYKFRSMRYDPAGASKAVRLTEREDRRVTRLGAFLRRTSLDEVPQFINVLLGQMSVVGPRPHPPGVKAGQRPYEAVEADFAERYKVHPGITGWAQVNGLRGNTFTEAHLTERFAYDILYIQNWSIELDIWIVCKTLLGGFGGKNAF
ncbi:MAG: exopolysaccharide biosynthesis polyprenyl glycosylphosphotransferase [Pseudomonas sp.]|uniref:exopolysaccharide biosynthesis polyprenyl glycosylphosphotransferase n=1 Tax=Pseudomonas sp. TaxID=306 RepID=UPI00339B4C88